MFWRDFARSFVWGLLWEGLVTLDIIMTAKGYAFVVMLTSIVLTITPYVFWFTIEKENRRVRIARISGLALGSGLGAFVTVLTLNQ